jgi:hypothetical protein
MDFPVRVKVDGEEPHPGIAADGENVGGVVVH